MSERESYRRGRDRDDDRGSRGRDRDDERSSRSRDDDDDRGGRSRDRGDDERSRDRGRSRDRDDEDRGSRRSSGSGRGYQYQARSAESVRDRANKGANDYDKILKDGVKTWKPNDGANRIRILPPTWEGAKHFGHDIFVHYGVGADRGQFLCLHKMLGKDDPIHEEYLRFKADMDPENKSDVKYAKDLEAKRRVLVYLIDRDHEKEGVQAWAMPWTLDRDIVKVSVDRGTGEVLPIDHPEEGYDVEFDKQGSKDRTEYVGVSIARRSTPLGKDEWLDYAMDRPLPDMLNYFDYDHIAKAFGGASSHKERDRDDDRGSRSRGRDDEDRGSHGRDRDDDRGGRSTSREQAETRGRSRDESPTWESVHEMTARELEDLIEQERLDIDTSEAKDDEDLADWICEEMKLEKKASGSRRRVVSDDKGDDDASDRLRKMREGRRD